MNKKLSYLVLICALLFFGCGRSSSKQETQGSTQNPISLHSGDKNYIAVDAKQSVVQYKGSKLIGDSHSGYVYISKGELLMEGGQLTGGTVEVDMNTIADIEHGSKNGLVDHLKSPDFFDVPKFPFAYMVITKVSTVNATEKEVTGNLTIKGITHPVTFPATVEIKDDGLYANAKLIIDRTKWGVRYDSGKFFDLVKDKIISDDIEFIIKIVANSKRGC